jgi:hypothetical protein
MNQLSRYYRQTVPLAPNWVGITPGVPSLPFSKEPLHSLKVAHVAATFDDNSKVKAFFFSQKLVKCPSTYTLSGHSWVGPLASTLRRFTQEDVAGRGFSRKLVTPDAHFGEFRGFLGKGKGSGKERCSLSYILAEYDIEGKAGR